MGRRGANQTAVLFAGLGTLACGLSPTMNSLIAARFVSVIFPRRTVSDREMAAWWDWWRGCFYDFDVCFVFYPTSVDLPTILGLSRVTCLASE
jgi:hypothetical protein